MLRVMKNLSVKFLIITSLFAIFLTGCEQAPAMIVAEPELVVQKVITQEVEEDTIEIEEEIIETETEPTIAEIEDDETVDDEISDNKLSEIIINEETDFYIIDVIYPETKTFPELDKYIETKIMIDIENFKKDITNEEWYEQDIEDPAMRHGDFVRIEVLAFTPQLFSARIHNSIYYGGAAHPMPYTEVINYNLETNKDLTLSDFFVYSSNYTVELSDFCINDFNFRLSQGDEWLGDIEWIINGAGPEEINFRAFNLTPEGILITFDAYQVAAYAAGAQEVLIPYSELQEILRDDLPLEFDHEDYMYN
jgi:Protein of unknown function (DUF3298)/Deacetylase PdaC